MIDKIQITAIVLFSILFFSCQSDKTETETNSEKKSEQETIKKNKFSNSSDFPEVDSLATFPNTIFNITLNQNISPNKNVIYAASIAYCWDEVKKHYNDKIKVDEESSYLNLLHQSNFHENVLDKNEYETSVKYEDGKLTVKAYFKKTLPFILPMTKYPKKEIFKKDSVFYFGFNGYEHEITSFVSLMYYQKNDFAIKMYPKGNEDQIILYSPSKIDEKSFATVYDELINKSTDFIKDGKVVSWKKTFLEEDFIRIPLIEFNLETQIKELKGNSFWVNEIKHFIIQAYQRNAFILNENGAIIESEGEMTEEASEEPEMEEKPEPKFFIFNKPFYVFLKKNNDQTRYPYFAILIQNTELLIKK